MLFQSRKSTITNKEAPPDHLLMSFYPPMMIDLMLGVDNDLTLLGLGLIKINTVSSNFNNPRPSLILNK